MANCAIVWFRINLRLDDNESLVAAVKAAPVVPVYVFDDRQFKGTTHAFGFSKVGVHRAQFIIEAIRDLRERLRAKGSDLVVRRGLPEEVLLELARETQSGWIYCNRERTPEEVRVQDKLEAGLWSIGQELRYNRGKLLYHTADLPFPVSHTPDTFTQFRKEVERIVPIREPIDAPESLGVLPKGLDPGEIPTLADLGYPERPVESRAAIFHLGGETAALARLKHYLWDTDAAKQYKVTRNGLLGSDYSTKFSAWLAQGCLSPKRIMREVQRYEAERGANESTYWIYFELLWRDYFRLMAKKYNAQIFKHAGPKALMVGKAKIVADAPNSHYPTFERWAEGTTGVPFVDANMRELNATGFMSNRGRQNVASFLVNDLKLNWLMGAEYMESLLIDYDVASNYGNWNYVAKVGADPREDRYFNILSQAGRYDPDGEFVRHWLPELANVPKDRIHRPDLLTSEEQREYGVRLGVDYPNAMVDMTEWEPGRGGRTSSTPSRPAARNKRRGSRGGRSREIPTY